MIDEIKAGIRGRKADETPDQYAQYVSLMDRRCDAKLAAMRDAMDLIERAGVAYPEVFSFTFTNRVDLTWECADQESFRAVVKALGSTIDNPWHKLTDSGNYRLHRSYGENIDLEVKATWGTCVQVQVGTKVSTTQEVVQPAVTREVVEETPVYEWQCPDTVLIEQLDAAAAESGTPALETSDV